MPSDPTSSVRLVACWSCPRQDAVVLGEVGSLNEVSRIECPDCGEMAGSPGNPGPPGPPGPGPTADWDHYHYERCEVCRVYYGPSRGCTGSAPLGYTWEGMREHACDLGKKMWDQNDEWHRGGYQQAWLNPLTIGTIDTSSSAPPAQ